MPKRSMKEAVVAYRRYWADLTEEDLTDEIEPVSDQWAADYEDELDRRDTLAAEGDPLARAEPDLFRRYWNEFIWPRVSGRKYDLSVSERKGHDGGWKTRTVAHRGHVRYRVERHLDPSRYWHRTAWLKPGLRPKLGYWLALPHGRSTRNVTVDIDNHGPALATFRRGFYSIHPIWPGTEVYPPDPPILTLPDLSVELLERARRLHGVLGPKAQWSLSSRSLGFHVILPLDRLTPSAPAADRVRRSVVGAGLPASTEVYPWGKHAHRLPFGLDFLTFDPGGDLVSGFPEQMRLYLKATPAPAWEDLLDGLLRHWRGLIEEASWHIVGRKTWRNLHGRIDATNRAIDRWRSGATVLIPGELGRGTAGTSSPEDSPKATAFADWAAYVERFRSKPHYWLAMVQDLAINGLPCPDTIDRAARELGRFLIHVQGLEPDHSADLVWRWAEAKHNGFITRLQTGRASDVRGQIDRVVSHVAGEEDFGGRLARMRAKHASAQYRYPIDLPALMSTPADSNATASSITARRKEETVILVDKNLSSEEKEAIWETVQRSMSPYQPQDLRRRPSWWQIVRLVVSYLEAHGGSAPVPKEVQATLGGSPPTVTRQSSTSSHRPG